MSKIRNLIFSLSLCSFLFSCNSKAKQNIIGKYADDRQTYLLLEDNNKYYLEYGDKSRSELIKKENVFGTTFFYLKGSKAGDYFKLSDKGIEFFDNQGFIETIYEIK